MWQQAETHQGLEFRVEINKEYLNVETDKQHVDTLIGRVVGRTGSDEGEPLSFSVNPFALAWS